MEMTKSQLQGMINFHRRAYMAYTVAGDTANVKASLKQLKKLEKQLESMPTETNERKFTVVNIDKLDGEDQIHMRANTGETVRFSMTNTPWTAKAFFTGKITKKELEKIIDIWWILDNQCNVKIGDSVTL